MDDNEFWKKLLASHDNPSSSNILAQIELEDFTPQYSKQTPMEPIDPQIPNLSLSPLNLGEPSTSQTWLPTGEQTVFEPGFQEHVEASWKWICDFDKRTEQGKKQIVKSTNIKSKDPEDKPFKTPHTKKQKSDFEQNNCNTTVMLCGREWDISEIPTPVCSCIGVPRKCNRWQEIGWQSTCCTANISQYPLPMLPGKGQIRLQGRRMGTSTFRCLLEELVTKGYEFRKPIDLKEYWLGANKRNIR